jgi:hypothetical protein
VIAIGKREKGKVIGMVLTGWIHRHKAVAVLLTVGALATVVGAAYAGTARTAVPGRGAVVNAITSELGITRAQLRADLASGETLAQLATANGVSVANLENAITAAVQSRLDQAVASGVLSASQEQAWLARLDARVGTLVNVAHPGAHAVFALRLRAAVVRLSAQYLGVSPTQLRGELRSGQTLAQIATSNGKTAAGLEQSVMAAVKTRLDRAVSVGNLSAQTEATALANLQSRLDQAVNRSFA